MLLSALYKQIESAGEDALQYAVFLASPDPHESDDVDVYVIGIGEVDIDHDKNEIRLIPRSSADPAGDGMPIFALGILMEQLPAGTAPWGDFEILAELPLNRDTPGTIRKSMTKVTAFHVGPTSGEAWFLVRPAAEYAEDVLPA